MRIGNYQHTIMFALLCGIVSLCPLAGQESGENSDFSPHEDDIDAEFAKFMDFGEDKGITVTGTLETTQQMTVIDREVIEKSSSRDLAALLEEEIDMSIVRFGGYGNKTEMNLRGFDTERIAVLIDGIPANSPRSGDFDISQIDLNNVERIEVIYGGSDTKYNISGALGGVINIITIKKQKPCLNLGFALSNTGICPENTTSATRTAK